MTLSPGMRGASSPMERFAFVISYSINQLLSRAVSLDRGRS
jgi:hypothetical protein